MEAIESPREMVREVASGWKHYEVREGEKSGEVDVDSEQTGTPECRERGLEGPLCSHETYRPTSLLDHLSLLIQNVHVHGQVATKNLWIYGTPKGSSPLMTI